MASEAPRVALVCADDYLFAPRLARTLARALGSRLVLVAVVKGRAIPTRRPSAIARHVATLLLLYGLRGLAFMTVNRIRAKSVLAVGAEFGSRAEAFSSVDDPKLFAQLEEATPDIILHQSPGRLSPKFLSIARLGTWNRHCGAVPRYRGLYAPFWAWVEQEPSLTVSLLEVTSGFDTGPVVAEMSLPIDPRAALSTVLENVLSESDEWLARTLIQPPIERRPQPETSDRKGLPDWKILARAWMR
jgi:folate-dependent phosphoribosylglycinamide formyltransferase PurN